MKLQAVRGTHDVLPGQVEIWQRVEEAARKTFALYGFREIRTPVFEDSAVFVKGTGEDSEIVQKEMFRFTDRGGGDLTLRPEGTPPVIRAYLEHHIAQGNSIDRLYYIGPMFRYERPQKGRHRQFHQAGVEVLGSRSPIIDAEVIEMAMRWLGGLGVEGLQLILNSVGDDASRDAYRRVLVAAQAERIDELCEDCRRRHQTNPLRVLDCKVPSCQPIIESLPSIDAHLTRESREHFDAVRRRLEEWSVPFETDTRMVRGLDYYCETVFEITSSALGAQDALLGGGRYDGLVAQMGGDDVPGVGFASGLERIVLAMPAGSGGSDADIFVVAFDDTAVGAVHDWVHRLRAAGIRALCAAYDARGKKAQQRAARRSGAAWSLLVGPDEIASGRYTLKRVADRREIDATDADLIDVAKRLVGRSS